MDKFIQCGDLGKLASIINTVKPTASLSGARVYVCEYENAIFVLKMIQLRPPCDDKHTTDTHTELTLLKWMRENIIDAGVSPCVVELLYDKTCKIPKISGRESDVANQTAIYRRIYIDMYMYQQHCNAGVMTNRVRFIAVEYCQVSLNDYLGWLIDDAVGEMMIKTFLFMIIYTLYAIDNLLPGTRHRDLHTGNIMIKFLKEWKLPVNGSYVAFTVRNRVARTWLLPFYGVFPKIIDFGSAISPTLNLNSCDETQPLNIRQNRDDMQTLLTFIYHRAMATGLNRIISIVNSLDPQMHHRRLVPKPSDEYPTLEQMLASEVFTEFVTYDQLQKKQPNIYKAYAVSVRSFGSGGDIDNGGARSADPRGASSNGGAPSTSDHTVTADTP